MRGTLHITDVLLRGIGAGFEVSSAVVRSLRSVLRITNRLLGRISAGFQIGRTVISRLCRTFYSGDMVILRLLACIVSSLVNFAIQSSQCSIGLIVDDDSAQLRALQVGIHIGDAVAQQGIAAFRIHAVLRDLVLVVVQESGFAVQVGFDAVTPWVSVNHRRSHCGGGSQRKRNYQSSSFHVKPHHLVVYRFCLC